MREENEYHNGHRIDHPLDFLGCINEALDCGREVLDKYAVVSCQYHCADPDRSKPFFSSGRLLGVPHPTSFSARLLSGILRLFRD